MLLGSVWLACFCLTQFLASLSLRCAIPVTTGSFGVIATSNVFLAIIHLGFIDFAVVLAECALVLSYSALGYVHLRLG